MLINADDMPNAKRDSLNQDCSKPDHKGDLATSVSQDNIFIGISSIVQRLKSLLHRLFNLKLVAGDLYSQDGNHGVGHMSGGEFRDNAKCVGKEEHINITISKEDTIKMTFKEGDKELSLEAPHSKENLQSFLGFLQQRFGDGDDSLEYKDIKKGSIELILKGSEKTLQSIATSFQSGELAPIVKQQFNLEIEDAKLIDSDKPENYNKNQGQKLLAFTIAGNVSQADIDILKAALVNNSDDSEKIKNEEKSPLVKEIKTRITKFLNPILGRASQAKLSEAILHRADLSEFDLREADFRGADLREADLRGANLSFADLSRADLSFADLRGSNLSRADLRGSNLSRADLSFADLRGANLSRADLSRANLKNTEINEKTKLNEKWLLVWKIVNQGIEGLDLYGKDLSNAYLSFADLSFANLSGANLIRADLSGANLIRADLSGANLGGADLSRADLSRANLKNTEINEKTKLNEKWLLVWKIVNQGIEGLDLYGKDLSNAYLPKTNLQKSNLIGTNFNGADLSGAHLSGAHLSEADLRRADLRRADLSEADLREASLMDANLIGTIFNRTKVQYAKFSNNQGISKTLKKDLKRRRAIFIDSDSGGGKSKILTPV